MLRATGTRSAVVLAWALALLWMGWGPTLAQAEDWPRFRGANGTGVSTSTGLPVEIGPGRNEAWSVDVQEGTSSPVIVGGQLYLTSFVDADRTVQCLDAQTGKELWRRTVQKVREENMTRPYNGPATCTPAADGQNVVVFYQDTGLLCYTNTGDLRWHTDVGLFHSMHGMASSPIIVDDKVILLADQIQGSYIAAYDLASGAPCWKVDRPDGVTGAYTTPSVAALDDGTLLVLASGAQGLFAYRASNGEVAFTVPGVSNSPITVPIVSGSHVFLCEPAGEGESMAVYIEQFDANKDGKLALEEMKDVVSMYRMMESMDRRWGNGDGIVEETEWNAAFASLGNRAGLLSIRLPSAGGNSEPHVEWTYRKDVPYVASPVDYDGLLFLITDGGVLQAIRSDNGELVRKRRLKKGGASFFASVVAADKKLFVVDTKGRLTVLKADASCEELFSADFGDGERVIATPAICDGRIYVRTKARLYCFSA